ncbi:mitochondrial cardiolipin hydrolase [Polyergus mexicanus]|uniref:mitochondrial cardiolipin hydrolase n=1 Tax=Polyergus mexicanus TaxID=615972 RepID=UPI0038B60411
MEQPIRFAISLFYILVERAHSEIFQLTSVRFYIVLFFLFNIVFQLHALSVIIISDTDIKKQLSEIQYTSKFLIILKQKVLVFEVVLHSTNPSNENKNYYSNLWYYYVRNTRDGTKIFEVMFFSKESALCRPHLECRQLCRKANCAVGYFRKIINYLDSATDTLDICMYFFTCLPLVKAIINAHKRGVVVRIVLDESMTQNDGSQIMCFYKEGIKPKFKQLDVLMHHKFVIIDNNILITGSTNWTMAAFFGNFENLMVTNESGLVKPFINEFENIWMMFNATEAYSKKYMLT